MWNFKEQYQNKVSNRFTALENLNVNVDSSRLGKILGSISKLQPKRV
jgi:hypothetical protein